MTLSTTNYADKRISSHIVLTIILNSFIRACVVVLTD